MTLTGWREIENCDKLQTDKYYDILNMTEDKFCFRFFDSKKVEYWFEKSLNKISQIIKGEISKYQI